MRFEPVQNRRKYLSLTSLIDVIFLLLLFFMLSSVFSKYSEIRLTSSSGTGSASAMPKLFVQLKDADWKINGTAYSDDEARRYFEEVQRDDEQVILRVLSRVTAQRFVDAIELLATHDLKPMVVK